MRTAWCRKPAQCCSHISRLRTANHKSQGEILVRTALRPRMSLSVAQHNTHGVNLHCGDQSTRTNKMESSYPVRGRRSRCIVCRGIAINQAFFRYDEVGPSATQPSLRGLCRAAACNGHHCKGDYLDFAHELQVGDGSK